MAPRKAKAAVKDVVIDADDDDEEGKNGQAEDHDDEEEEGEEEEGEEEADGEEGEEGDEDDDEDGDEDDDLEYYREDGEEDQEDDDDSEDEEGEEGEKGEEGEEGEEGEDEGEGEDEDEEADPDADVPKNVKGAKTHVETGAEEEEEHAPETDSEDEMPINTIGNVPLEWYDDFDHVGYDLEGRKLLRGAKKDELDALIDRFDNPDAGRTIHDYVHGVDVVLSDADLQLIKRLQSRKYPDASMNPYSEMRISEYADKLHPLSAAPPRKAPFIPSKHEAKAVMKLVYAMRSESYQKSVANRKKQDAKDAPNYEYLLWDEPLDAKHHKRLPAPKMALPGNAESYNPPAEYLFSPEEKAAWDKMDPSDRPLNFTPQTFDALRKVPLYAPLIKERFERCLDLYLCPREQKTRLNIEPDSLIPSLPKPQELRPYPERLSTRFVGHTARVYSISVSPSGEWLLSSSADGTVKLWEVANGRCARTLDLGGEVRSIAWNPNGEVDVAAATIGPNMALLRPQSTPGARADRAAALLEGGSSGGGGDGAWLRPSAELRSQGVEWVVAHPKSASSVVWHHKGDYLASVAPDGASKAVLLHQVSKRTSGSPFAKSKGRIEAVTFHPTKPLFFVATQRHIRVYNLLKQELLRKLNPSVKWISSIDVHPGGDNLICGSYDRRLCWFDMDLSTSPYKMMRSHTLAVRTVAFHPKLPLFASASDDAAVHVYHGRVYADLLSNPLIVPLKILRGHTIKDHIGVLAVTFHPNLPWVFSAAADGIIHLYTD